MGRRSYLHGMPTKGLCSTWFLMVTVVCISCRKEETKAHCTEWGAGTVFEPLPYLPAYPGSTWTYVDTNGVTSVQRTSENYMPHQFERSTCTTQIAWVPVWNGRYLYGYRTPITSEYYTHPTSLSSLLVDAPAGYLWVVQYWQGNYWAREVTARDTNIVVQGTTYSDVLVIAELYGDGTNYHASSWSFYARDIGLVRVDKRRYTDTGSDTVAVLELVDHYINR